MGSRRFNTGATLDSSSPNINSSKGSSVLFLEHSQESVGTSPTQSPGHQGLAIRAPERWTGPRVVTFLLEELPEQLQVTIRTFSLPPHRVQGGQLVKHLSDPSQWTLELSVVLLEIEGAAVFSSMIVDCPGSPGWEQGS